MGVIDKSKLQIINAKRDLALLLLKKKAENLTPSESNILSHLMNDRDIQDILDKVMNDG